MKNEVVTVGGQNLLRLKQNNAAQRAASFDGRQAMHQLGIPLQSTRWQ